jgi:hypothetical protein
MFCRIEPERTGIQREMLAINQFKSQEQFERIEMHGMDKG